MEGEGMSEISQEKKSAKQYAATIHFTTNLGASVSIEVENYREIMDVQRQLGKYGWTSGQIPPGGLRFPYDNETDFDWHLLGASYLMEINGDWGVFHRGEFYKRRDLPAVDSKKMTLPATIKYSRGAKPTDPPNIREGDEEGIQYVTLVQFRGKGRNDNFAIPREK
jgi:hypothetical protein